MRLAYAYAAHHRQHVTGGTIHIKQFIANAIALGHEVWTWPGDTHPGTRALPRGRLQRLATLRQLDVIYYRVDFGPPASAYLGVPPYRQLVDNPLIVWELNGVPAFGRIIGQSDADVQHAIDGLGRYGRHCNLAICVSEKMAQYARVDLGLANVLTVPNGSDPDLFNPDVSPISRIKRGENILNVVWIGSGELAWVAFNLLQETAQILERYTNDTTVHFHIIGAVGPGLMRTMPATVHYHGPETYETLPVWLAAMDVGLIIYQPGIADYNSPLKLYDYMASGLVVISTPQPQVEQVFAEMGQQDSVIAADDPAALAEKLLELARDRQRLRELGKKGRNLVLNYYNWRRNAREIMDAIEKLR
jgi:glycosyltransferase involved in cell wall biosynthesis